MFVNKLSTPYETYSSLLFNGGKSFNISEKHWVSLMLYSFWHRGYYSKYSAITLLQLYVKVPVWSMIGLNFNSSTLISSVLLNLWVLAVASNFTGWFATIKWISRKVKSLIKVKSKNSHPSCVVNRGKCSCGEEDIVETERNVGVNMTTQQKKLNQQDICLKTLVTCLRGKFWCLLQADKRMCKNLEAFFIAVQNPSLN